MNNNAKIWVEALRSGKFKQGKGALLTGEGYCCLGVACALYQEAGNRLAAKVFDGGWLPDVVKIWLGLSSYNGHYFGSDGKMTWLVNDNDYGYGKTFHQIATIIESEPEGLFKKEARNED